MPRRQGTVGQMGRSLPQVVSPALAERSCSLSRVMIPHSASNRSRGRSQRSYVRGRLPSGRLTGAREAEQSGHGARGARAEQRGWRMRSPPTAVLEERTSACRSIGPRHSLFSGIYCMNTNKNPTLRSPSAESLETSGPKFGAPDLTELHTLIRPFPKDARERDCYRYLLQQMQVTPDRPRATKGEFKETCRRRFHVTVDSFEYCWREAIKASGPLGSARAPPSLEIFSPNPPRCFSPSGVLFCLPQLARVRLQADENMPRKIEEGELAGASPVSDGRAAKADAKSERLLTPEEESQLLRVSLSWLAKARMRGDGPPYVMVGRSIRYTAAGNRQWIRSRQRFSTSDR